MSGAAANPMSGWSAKNTPSWCAVIARRRNISTEQLIEREFDVAYAYKPLHHPGLPHAFLNSILYLDYDRRGFRIPSCVPE